MWVYERHAGTLIKDMKPPPKHTNMVSSPCHKMIFSRKENLEYNRYAGSYFSVKKTVHSFWGIFFFKKLLILTVSLPGTTEHEEN